MHFMCLLWHQQHELATSIPMTLQPSAHSDLLSHDPQNSDGLARRAVCGHHGAWQPCAVHPGAQRRGRPHWRL